MALADSSVRQPAMAALGLGTQVGVLLPYGRIQESEADVLGLQLMASAGFDPAQAIPLWQNMGAASKGNRHRNSSRRTPRVRAASRKFSLSYLPSCRCMRRRAMGRKPQCQS